MSRKTVSYNFIFVLVPCVLLLILSYNSFLFALNVTEDSNCFMTSARAMLSGKVLYRDFFEQKGPFIYFLYGAGLGLVPGSYHGVYIIEVIFAYFHYKYTFKTLCVINKDNDKLNFLVTSVFCSFFYVSFAFNSGEVEEFCFPLLSYFLYLFIKRVTDDYDIRLREFFITGIFIGLVFWTKFFCVVMFGVPIIYLIVRECKKKNFLFIRKMVLFGFLGFLSVTIFVVSYCLITGSLSSMIEVYFYTNIFEYPNQASLFITFSALIFATIAPTLLVIALCTFLKFETKYHELIVTLLICYGITAAIMGVFGRSWFYYYSLFYVYDGIFAVIVFKCTMEKYNKVKPLHLFFITGCIFATMFFTEWFDTNIVYDARYEMIQDMKAEIQDEKLDYFIMDFGYYFSTNSIPDDYYMFTTNARRDIIVNDIICDLKTHDVKYIVTTFNTDSFDEVADKLDRYGYEPCIRTDDYDANFGVTCVLFKYQG